LALLLDQVLSLFSHPFVEDIDPGSLAALDLADHDDGVFELSMGRIERPQAFFMIVQNRIERRHG
jgi:hypothetical protein